VSVTALIRVEVEAQGEDEARLAAEGFVRWLDPTAEFLALSNEEPDHHPVLSASIDIEGESDVEAEDDDRELCPVCWDQQCEGCSPPDTPALDDSFHRGEMDV
jgi:hypothetical protein